MLLNNKSKLWSGKVAVAADEVALGKVFSRPIRSCCNENDAVVAREVWFAVIDFINYKRGNEKVEEAWDEVLCKTSHNAQSGAWLVVFGVLDELTLELLRNNINWETLNKHIAKLIRCRCSHRGVVEELVGLQLIWGADRNVLNTKVGHRHRKLEILFRLCIKRANEHDRAVYRWNGITAEPLGN